MRIGSAVSALTLLAAPAAAGIRLSGTERVRVETISGQARAGFNSSDTLLNFRTTLLAEYGSGPVQLAAELWDSRVFGADRRTPVSTNEVNTLELVQVFLKADLGEGLGANSRTSVQIGRLMLNLGSRRLVAADDYRNTTNGYTGLRVDYANKAGWQATAIYTLPQQRRPDRLDALLDNKTSPDHEGFDLVLWGGTVSKARVIGEVALEGTYIHLGERDRPSRPTRNRSLDTFGGRVLREPAIGKFDLEFEGFVQRGEVATSLAPNAALQSVRAWFFHADAGYTFRGAWKPRLSFDYDHASGDGRGGRFGRFDTLFGMRRADLAPAGLYNAIARTNLISPGVRLEAVPDKKTDWFVSYRPMWLASRFDSFSSTGVRDASGRSGRFAGHQVDSRIRRRVSPWLTLEADAVLLRKGRFLTEAPNAPPKRWTRYLSLNVSASF
ncbi:alginate export family protein [Sphingomonas sp.]|jgi:hypothetical protein|uniref:alginate export family protein n=1 Tax=Sphingomonas sp. TaxID=28214 RepID=UPI002DF38F97|nr:alginate export family protein [Sphingomonas sp.]